MIYRPPGQPRRSASDSVDPRIKTLSMENPKSRVAVLMAVCNGIQFLPEQVDSIMRQSSVVVDLWISDDNSTDGSYEWCLDLASRDPQAHTLPKSGPFGSASANFFRLLTEVDLAGYEFIAFADQDDIWDHDKLAVSIEQLQAGNFEGVSSDVTAFWPDGTKKLIIKSQVQKALDYVLESAGPGCTYLMRVDFASEVAAWINECSWERPPPHDWLIYAYCRTRNYRWHVIPRSTVMYRQHGGNFLGANYGFSGKLARLRSIYAGDFRRDVEQVSSLLGSAYQVQTSKRALLLNWKVLRRDWREAFIFFLMCLVFW